MSAESMSSSPRRDLAPTPREPATSTTESEDPAAVLATWTATVNSIAEAWDALTAQYGDLPWLDDEALSQDVDRAMSAGDASAAQRASDAWRHAWHEHLRSILADLTPSSREVLRATELPHAALVRQLDDPGTTTKIGRACEGELRIREALRFIAPLERGTWPSDASEILREAAEWNRRVRESIKSPSWRKRR